MSAAEPAPLVTPQLLEQLERLELISRKIFRGRLQGERRSRRRGQSVEFADFRNYTAGDDVRFLDWNLYARLDRLFLKLFLEEEDLHVFTLIDSSDSMEFGSPTKLHFAKQLAAALGFIGLCRSDRVRIESLGEERRSGVPAWRGRSDLWRMLGYLEAVTPGRNLPLEAAVRRFCLRNKGQGVLVLISDLMDKSGYESAMRLLLARSFDVYVIHVLSREELEPDLKGDLKLLDSEDGDAAEITVSRPLLQRYRRALDAFVVGAREFCTRRGITYLMTASDASVEHLVTDHLRRRGLLK